MTKTQTKTEVTENGARKPSDQALQLVDTAFGVSAGVADAVTKTVDTWRKPETRSQEIETLQKKVSSLRDREARSTELEELRGRLTSEYEKAQERGPELRRKVTDQVVEQARKARERVEPVRQRVEPVYRERVEPVYKQRVEPVYRDRVEPVYRQRVEPTVKRVRERI
jgi:hypothetical protein